LKNGVAMRVVLGDLSWKLLPEPQEYVYAAYLKAELPHRDLEAAMLEEVCLTNFSLPILGRYGSAF
jgi:hypothetical protein